MRPILSKYSVSISELKKSPSSIIEEAQNEAVAVLNHNKPSAYLVPSKLYEKLMEIVDDYYLSQELKERLNDNEKAIKVNIDEL